MRDEIERFVAGLAIPEERKAVVAAELVDHVACAREAAARDGRDPDAAAREALGDLGALGRALEAVEPGFRIRRWEAMARGVVASIAVAVVIAYGGATMRGTVGALLAIAIAAACAPPFAVLRGELRAPRIPGRLGRSRPIGPAITYAFTVMSTPFLIWMAMAIEQTRRGAVHLDVPWSCFAVMAVVCAVLLAEAARVRRTA